MTIDDSPIIARLSVRKVAPGQCLFAVSHGGEVLYEDPGFTSIEEHQRCQQPAGPIRGFEIAYQGVVVGTYLIARTTEIKPIVAAVSRPDRATT